MSDTQYEVFQHYGTNAQRLAFTPSPAAGIQPIYIWFATDTGLAWLYDTSWHQINSAGGTIPATVQGDMLYASAANTISALAKNTTATRYLSNTGGSNNPAWSQVNVANGVTGVLPVANGGTGSSSGASIISTSTTLTDAQIKALPTTGITLVAASGANTRIRVHGASVMYSFVTATYTNINASSAQFGIRVSGAGRDLVNPLVKDTSTTAPITTFDDMFAGAVHDGIFDFNMPSASIGNGWWTIAPWQVNSSISSQANTAIEVYIDNSGTGNLTGGNVANWLKLIVYYSIESTT